MKNMFNDTLIRRLLALLLCVAMVLPLCISGSADDSVADSNQADQTETQSESQTDSDAEGTYYAEAGSDSQTNTQALGAQDVTYSATSNWSVTLGNYLQTVRSGESLKTGVPYVITEKDSTGSYKWMLTGETATKVTGSVTSSGLLLDSNADPDTTHVWYYDGTYLRYGSADGKYLLLNYDASTGLHTVTLSSTLDTSAAAKPVQVSDSDQFNLQRADGSATYLNRHGGTSTSNVALTYTYSGSSLWYLSEVVSNVKTTVSISAPKNVVTSKGTVQLTPYATVNDREISNVTVTWRSLDPSIATVSSSGLVTGVKAGQVYIRATLNAVEGGDVTTLVYADMLMTVMEVSGDESAVSATIHFGQQKLELVSPQAGGTYLIDFNYGQGWYLSGNRIAPGDEGYNGLNSKTGLEAVNHVPLYDGMWYFDGTNLYHGSTKDTSKCLVYANGSVAIGTAGTGSEAFAVVAGTTDMVRILQVSAGKLNLYGGAPHNVPYLYSGHNDMRFFTVTPARVVKLTVTPGQKQAAIGVPSALVPTVTVDGTAVSNYTINWASSNESAVTVGDSGKLTGIAPGSATITATLTAIDGEELSVPLTVEISVNVPEMKYSGDYIYSSMLANPGLELATTLQENVPYVVTSNNTGAQHMVLTNIQKNSSADASYSGFRLMDYSDVVDKYVWYVEKETVDGTEQVYLRFGNLTNANNYLGAEYIGVDASNTNRYKLVLTSKGGSTPIFNSLTPNGNGDGSYLPRAVSKDYVYLNQWGGGSHDTAVATRAWTAYWRFNVLKDPATVSLWANPSSYNLQVDGSAAISPILKVNDVQVDASNFEVGYFSSNPGVATVIDGKVCGLRAGTATITVVLNWVKDDQLLGADVKDTSCQGLALSIPVTVQDLELVGLSTNHGYLPVGSSDRVAVTTAENGDTGIVLAVSSNGTTKQMPLLSGYLFHADGTPVDTSKTQTLTGLKVVYLGTTLYENFTLDVYKGEKPDYPEYPNEGSVVIDKTAEGVNFQSSGLAQVELSVNGIPLKPGADVIIMLDTSSSMNVDRMTALVKSLNDMITTLKSDGPDGSPMDFRIAVADFNAYFSDTDSPYYQDPADTLVNNSVRSGSYYCTTSDHHTIFTGDKTISAGAFISVHDESLLDNPFNFKRTNSSGVMCEYEGETSKQYTLGVHGGTNYDYAFDVIYELGRAISDANAKANENRDLYVIFMSDGAPFQYNYFGSQSNTGSAHYWNNFVTGTMTEEMFKPDISVDPFNGAHNEYYHPEGKHWMAEAIMGQRDQDYKVIRKNDPMDDNGDNWIDVKGLDATMYSIGFCLQDDNMIVVDSMETVLKNVASSEAHARFADEDELANVFSGITSEIMNAVSDAYFVDTMGAEYDLLMSEMDYELNGVKTTFSDSKIQIKTYEIFTHADYEENLCTWEQIGVRKTDANGDPITSVIEEVTFNADGTAAYSDGDKTVNILKNGVICAKNFWYNTSTTSAKTITLDSGKTYSLAPETFYWKVGTISTTELALSYYVYLTRAQGEDGGRLAGIYNTNEDATLYYENYLGNDCHLVAPIPELLWEHAKVGYGFYLVDDDGNPVVDDTTAETGSFLNSVKLTDVVTIEFTTNGDPQLIIAADFMEALTEAGYELYDPAAKYMVNLNSDGFGRVRVFMDEDCTKQTTYVTGLGGDPTAYGDPDGTIHEFTDFATANTVVWFAVKPAAKAIPDVVVIDYGLDVEIDVLLNDILTGGEGTLAYVGGTDVFAAGYEEAKKTNENLTLDDYLLSVSPDAASLITTNKKAGTYGEAQVSDGKVRYSLNSSNGMQMDKQDTFVYVMKYEDGPPLANGYYYSTVTVIPATTIYFEDNFGSVSYSAYAYDVTDKDQKILDTDAVWSPTDADAATSDQETDRPGKLDADDANNIYGTDSAYETMEKFSMGSSMVFTAKYNDDTKIRTVGMAEFTFTGTGFDIIAMSSNTTGIVFAAIYKAEDLESYTTRPIPSNSGVVPVDTIAVDTYYGYKYVDSDKDGFYEWVPAAAGDGEDAKLYQVPVLKKSGLEYGKYTVILTVSYSSIFDHEQYTEDQYDFYLDAIRIYDPANDGSGNEVIEGAYVDDHEGWPEYFELRNLLIDRGDLDYTSDDGSLSIAGVAFMDSATTADKTYDITNYLNFGPNNELYLTKNQAVAFKLDVTESTLDAIHMAMKCVGSKVEVEYYNLKPDGVTKEDYTSLAINTATDLYYDITDLNGDIVVIKNVSDGILSITNVKVTYKEAHEDGLNTDFITVDQTVVDQVLGDLNNTLKEEEELPEESDSIKLGSLSLSLESEVVVNLYYTLNGITADTKDMGLLTWDTKPEKVDYASAQTVIAGALTDGTRCMVSTNGIPAKQMGDDIYMCVYVDNGNGTYTYSDLVVYSPKQYALNRLEKSSDEDLKKLCVALLNYGTEAQKYFTYKTNDLMNMDLTAEQLALVSAYNDQMLSSAEAADEAKFGSFTKTEGCGSVSVTLSMDGDIALNYYVKPEKTVDEDITFYYWTAETYAKETLTADNAAGVVTMQRVVNFSNDTVSYWAAIDGIAAKEMEDVYYLTAVYKSGGETYCTGVTAYSAATYCNNKAGGNGSMKALAEATVVYGYYAAEYFGKEA